MDFDLSPLGGRQLPQPGRLITRLRDAVILDLPSIDKPKLSCTRTAVLFGEDAHADPRVIDVLLAFHYRALKYRVNLIALAKVRHLNGTGLRWWYGSRFDADRAHRELSEASHVALWPADRWEVEPATIAPMRDGVLDRDRLQLNDLLRVVPESYRLGLVRP
jgi:hypothetical protein